MNLFKVNKEQAESRRNNREAYSKASKELAGYDKNYNKSDFDVNKSNQLEQIN